MKIIAEIHENNKGYHIQLSDEPFHEILKQLNPDNWHRLEGKLISKYELDVKNIEEATNEFSEYFSSHLIDTGLPYITGHSSVIILPESYQGKPIQYEHVLEQLPFKKVD